MPTMLDSLRNTLNSKFWSSQPEENDVHMITLCLSTANKIQIRLCSKRSLYRKCFLPTEQLFDATEHQPTCLNCHTLRIKRGESTGNLVSIHKLPAIKDFRKYRV